MIETWSIKLSKSFNILNRIYENEGQRRSKHLAPGTHKQNGSTGVLYRKDIFYEGSLYNIPEYK